MESNVRVCMALRCPGTLTVNLSYVEGARAPVPIARKAKDLSAKAKDNNTGCCYTILEKRMTIKDFSLY